MRLAALDVQYAETQARVACVVWQEWSSDVVQAEWINDIATIAPYEPGAFYRRELPCLLTALAVAPLPIDMVLIDGYVWLDAQGRPGLGAHLFAALGQRQPVVGVAKTAFNGSPHALALLRGEGQRPLYITAAGVAETEAAAGVAAMHGPYRVPTLLRRVDQLCRGQLQPQPLLNPLFATTNPNG